LDELDKLDLAIIAALKVDGRITVTALADRVGLSKTPCQVRLKRLEQQGYIRGYGARVDHHKLGTHHVAFVQITLSDTKTAALEAFNRAVEKIPEVEQCHMIASNFDYLLKVRTSDMVSYRQVLGEQISALPHVLQTSTFVAMESVKDD